ncbi:MAG: YkgJ family cysteine cluster protein [Candidatus Omnitrophota bacterium]
MFTIKQFVTSDYCLRCLGCCRYSSNSSVWAPNLLEQEKRKLGLEKIELIPVNETCVCSFLNSENNHCRIYKKRPLECRLYPFLVNYRDGKLYLSVHTGCPFVKDGEQSRTINSKEFKRYLDYLIRCLLKPRVSSSLNESRKDFYSYPAEQVENLAELEI